MGTTPITIAYLGPTGTYTEAAAEAFLGYHPHGTIIPCSNIASVVKSVTENIADYAVVPIENSLEGSVNVTLDILAHEAELYIVREFVLAISHCLFSRNSDSLIKRIASHPQALAQCRQFIMSHYPGAETEAVDSTAKAAEMVAAGLVDAAIASPRAGKVFGLNLVQAAVEDQACNQTRFIALGREMETEGADKISIACRIRGDQPGSLCDILTEFARRSVNLTRIESRPARTGLGEYIFFIDLEGSLEQPSVRAALDRVTTKSIWLKNLGVYPLTRTV